MKIALLTGATGFIGRACVAPLIARGFTVHAVSHRPDAANAAPEGATLYHVDLHDTAAVRRLLMEVRPSHLLHAAWDLTPGKYLNAPENVEWLGSSLELIRTFASTGGTRVVAAGSSFEYDPRFGYCSERITPLAPSSLYGACKRALGELLESASGPLGLSAAWGRIFFVYGPHEHPRRLVASVIRSLLAGERARCSHGNQVRDFLHAADVGDALAAVLDSLVTGAVNIASGRPVALRDLIFRIASRLDGEDRIDLGAVPVPADEPPLLVADVRRLAREVGWAPSLDLDTGLEQTIQWWRARA